MYAVINDRGKQYTVKAGERVRVDLMDVEPGSEVVFDRVLLVGGGEVAVAVPVGVGVGVLEGSGVAVGVQVTNPLWMDD